MTGGSCPVRCCALSLRLRCLRPQEIGEIQVPPSHDYVDEVARSGGCFTAGCKPLTKQGLDGFPRSQNEPVPAAPLTQKTESITPVLNLYWEPKRKRARRYPPSA